MPLQTQPTHVGAQRQSKQNIAIKHMFRNRRQREGRRPEPPPMPPVGSDFEAALYPGFAWVGKEEHEQRTNLFMPPAFETNALEELPTSFKPDTELDPIPQSNFYAANNKIRPWAVVRAGTAGYLAISEIEGVDNSDFENSWIGGGPHGKIVVGQLIGQYVGYQNPIDITPLIPEADYTTYGALNQLTPDAYARQDEDAYLFA